MSAPAPTTGDVANGPAGRRRHSAHPATVADLLPAARRLAMKIDGPPSRNQIMRALHIGAPKAREVLAALEVTTADSEPDTPPAPGPARPAPTTDGHDQADDPPADDAPRDTGGPAVDEPADPPAAPVDEPAPPAPTPADPSAAGPAAEPASTTLAVPPVPTVPARPVRAWPLLLLALPAAVAIWSGWVGLGSMAGFGIVHPLPGIADHWTIDSAICLPIGVEAFAAYALRVWLSGAVPAAARRFARVSALASLAVGGAGQVVYHLLSAAHVTAAPWPVTVAVACLPVAVLGMGAALAHLIHTDRA